MRFSNGEGTNQEEAMARHLYPGYRFKKTTKGLNTKKQIISRLRFQTGQKNQTLRKFIQKRQRQILKVL